MQKYKQGLELGGLQVRFSTGYLGIFSGANTADRTYALPDKSGTFALLSDFNNATLTGNATIYKILLDSANHPASGIKFYSASNTTWQNYIAAGLSTGNGYDGNLTAPSGTYVAGWALRSLVTNYAGYGWTWERGSASTTTPEIVAELACDTGNFKTIGNIYALGGNFSDALTIKKSTDALLLLKGGGATSGFMIQGASTKGGYIWNYENAEVGIATNNTMRMTISAAGAVNFKGNSLSAGVITGTNFIPTAYATVDGSIGKAADGGLMLRAATGTSVDFVLVNPGNTARIMCVPTGTLNTYFSGEVHSSSQFVGSGAGLTSIPGANITGSIPFAALQSLPTFGTAYGNLNDNAPWMWSVPGLQWDSLAFTYPTSVETLVGTTWTAGTIDTATKSLFLGGDLEGGGIGIASGVDAWRCTWSGNAPYTFLEGFFLKYSTNGNNCTLIVEKSADGSTWTNVVTSTAFNSWPGHCVIPARFNTRDATYLRLTITRDHTNTNVVVFTTIKTLASYGPRPRVFTWDTNKDVSFANNVTAATYYGSGAGLTNVNAASLQGKSNPSSGNWFNTIPFVSSDGIMEVGKYIDFHETSADTSDYSVRLFSSSNVLTCYGDFAVVKPTPTITLLDSTGQNPRIMFAGQRNAWSWIDSPSGNALRFSSGGSPGTTGSVTIDVSGLVTTGGGFYGSSKVKANFISNQVGATYLGFGCGASANQIKLGTCGSDGTWGGEEVSLVLGNSNYSVIHSGNIGSQSVYSTNNVNHTLDTTSSTSQYIPFSSGQTGITALKHNVSLYFIPTTGIVYATDFSASSDKRLKTDIKPLTNALDKVKAITGVTYKWNELSEVKDKETEQVGVLAQDVLEVLPQAVNSNGEYLSVSYGKLVPLLIEAIKEQQKQIDELKRMIK